MMKNKKIATIALALLLTTAMVAFMPSAVAQKRITPYIYIGAIPNPVHVGDEVLFHVGITLPCAWPQTGWKGLTITLERPDGKTETLGPINTDTTGGTGYLYRPTLVGTYYAQVNFPEQVVEVTTQGVPAGTIINAGVSDKLALIVQEEPLEYWPGIPLPTEYWTRPINSQFREWASISGNWLVGKGYYMDMNCPGNDDAPEAPHVLWAKPLVKGGISALGGGLAGGTIPYDFEYGDAYEGLFGQPVVIGGVLYFNRYKADGGTAVEQEVVAVDLHTGEEIWVRDWNRTRLAFGQVFYWDSYNYHGVFGYLWTTVGTTWHAYEASTGRWAFSIANVPSGTNLYGPKGEILRYNINVAAGWMTKWNSTHVLTQTRVLRYGPLDQAHGSWIREYMGTTLNGTLGIEWNVTIPKGLTEGVPPAAGPATIYLEDRIIGTNFSRAVFAPDVLQVWAISTAPETKGQLIFNVTWPRPRPDTRMHISAASVEDGVFVIVAVETAEKWGFDINTGRLLWGPTEREDYKQAWSYTTGYSWDFIYNGKYFSQGLGGQVFTFDVKTGKLLWKYDFVDNYHEWTFGNNWFVYSAFIADGKLYIYPAEHSPNNPQARGAYMACINIETGEEVWKLNYWGTVWGGKPVIGDSIIAALNEYDMRVYAIGKGPTTTTVSVPETAQPLGTPVLIKGTVMDISPGTQDSSIKLRFPQGVPAVADESMSDWMACVYMQFPRPTDVKGVWVTFDVISPSGEWKHIGGTHTDSSGMYSIPWTPPSEGLWTIVITFPGSESYWPSYAETSVLVTAAPPPPPTPETPQIPTPPDYTPYFIALTIAIIIIALLVVYILISIRKVRKA